MGLPFRLAVGVGRPAHVGDEQRPVVHAQPLAAEASCRSRDGRAGCARPAGRRRPRCRAARSQSAGPMPERCRIAGRVVDPGAEHDLVGDARSAPRPSPSMIGDAGRLRAGRAATRSTRQPARIVRFGRPRAGADDRSPACRAAPPCSGCAASAPTTPAWASSALRSGASRTPSSTQASYITRLTGAQLSGL